MKRYPNCVHKLFYEPLCITPARHASLCKVLEARMATPSQDERDPEGINEPDFETYGSDAVIPVHGVLVGHEDDIPASSCGCGLDRVNAMINLAEDDEEITRVIFDFRTPGGSVDGLPETAEKIADMTKETIAFVDEANSAGYWLASQCQRVYARGTRRGKSSATLGNVGVWCAYLDISRQMENEGVNMQAISAGKYKLLGAYWKPLTEEERAMLQADVDKVYRQFKEAVLLRREVSDEFMQGQMFDGMQAVEIGLCDGLVDGIEDLLAQ